ncbi:MAG: hypothetical protein ACRELA_11990 [Candidatus Rokuibacteriota bacterium]
MLPQAYRLKDHARQMAARAGRPYQYFGERTRKDELARQLAERDGIQEGLVCVFAVVEPCRTFLRIPEHPERRFRSILNIHSGGS